MHCWFEGVHVTATAYLVRDYLSLLPSVSLYLSSRSGSGWNGQQIVKSLLKSRCLKLVLHFGICTVSCDSLLSFALFLFFPNSLRLFSRSPLGASVSITIQYNMPEKDFYVPYILSHVQNAKNTTASQQDGQFGPPIFFVGGTGRDTACNDTWLRIKITYFLWLVCIIISLINGYCGSWHL